MKAIQYCIGGRNGARRHMFVRQDPSNECALSIANVPFFLDEDAVRILLNKVVPPISVDSVVIKRSSSADGNLLNGYRSGTVTLSSIKNAKKFIDSCEAQSVISLVDDCKITLPSYGSKRIVDQYNSKIVSVEELLKSANDVVASYEESTLKEKESAKNAADDDGWVTVSRKNKIAFRGTINYKNNEDGAVDQSQVNGMPSIKKRKQKD